MVIKDIRIYKKNRSALAGLSFLCLFLFLSCQKNTNNNSEKTFEIVWEDGFARKIIFYHPSLLKKTADLKVTLHQKSSKTALLGDFYKENENLTFKPLIPFTPELTYDLYNEEILIDSFRIPLPEGYKAPEVRNVFPTLDTLPENLLKMYIDFSEPMRPYHSKEYITVINNDSKDTVDVFLTLQNELWNEDDTRLTLWLDPGRVKTDLIPNRERGLPIIQGNTYELIVSKDWKSKKGYPLPANYKKTFFVTSRDLKKPSINNWNLNLPMAGSQSPLRIDFNEAMDAVLAVKTLAIYTAENKKLKGSFSILENETAVTFKPETAWKKNEYLLKVESRLEDHAGNNLNRLFDTDLLKEQPGDELYYQRAFRIEN